MDKDRLLTNDWALDLCGFWSYKESNGVNPCCPYMCPMAVLGTCFTLGKIRTLLEEEPPSCGCEMGPKGLICCLLSTPINICGPAGGCIWFMINAIEVRAEVKQKHGIKENSSMSSCAAAVLYPCSFYQVLMTLRKIREAKRIQRYI